MATALRKDSARDDKHGTAYGYLKRGRYATQVEGYLRYFSPRQMYFMLFEDFVAKPAEELQRLAQFLNVSQFDEAPPRLHSHASTVPRFTAGIWLARKLFGDRHPVHRLATAIGTRFPGPRPPFPKTLQRDLAAEFAPHNARLSTLTGLDLSAWHKPYA